MPIIKSAKKRVKQSATANLRNARTKRTMREAIKAFNQAVAGGKAADIESARQSATSAIDVAAKKNVIHKNKAARQKSAISAKAKAAGAKVTKKAPAKPVTKKTSPKKAAPKPKKPAAKKPAVKK